MFGLNELLFFVVSAVVYFVGFAFALATGIYFGNKWTKKGELPGILQILEKDKKG